MTAGEAGRDAGQRIARSRRRARMWLIGIGAAAALILALRFAGAIPSVHSYYTPSDAMAPTLVKNDRILAATGIRAPFTRGEVILFRTGGGATYIKRIAGLPGDRIALVGGKVVLNGTAVPQQLIGTQQGACEGVGAVHDAQRLSETFPGEAGRHQIYDCGDSAEDDFAEQRVAPRHLFVLGDNRDNSADSRIPPEAGGVSQVAMDDVVGRAPVYTVARGRKMLEQVR